MKRRIHHLLALALCCGFTASTASVASAQSNLVYNGSFEIGLAGWEFPFGLGWYQNQGAADGTNHVATGGPFFQNLTTESGRLYVLTMAAHRYFGPQPFWSGVAIPALTNYDSAGFVWDYRYCYVHAESNVTELRFDGQNTAMDDIWVYPVDAPIQMLSQPQDRSAYEGGTVSFLAKARGTPPLRYQWYLNDAPIPGATNRSFTAKQLRQSHAGTYYAVVANPWNSVTSQVAQLQVIAPPTSPVIIAQPSGDNCPVGYSFSFQVGAVGEAPLSYQWLRDNAPVTDATNATLTFASIQASHAGQYSVIVSNHLGTVLSLSAVLEITNATGGARITFDTATNNAAIYDVDGVTRLNSNFVAQIYGGSAPGILRAMGDPIPFQTGLLEGYLKYVNRTVPDVPGGQTAYVQVRAWEAAAGATYEQARAAGGKYGFSAIIPVFTTRFITRVDMQSFSLRAGQPFFVAGILGIGDSPLGEPPRFTLSGEIGVRYLVEKRQMPNSWVPFLIVTNATGTVIFSDPSQTNAPMQLYRARILD